MRREAETNGLWDVDARKAATDGEQIIPTGGTHFVERLRGRSRYRL
jgi:hypothetical protein